MFLAFLFQAVQDNAKRAEQEALAAQRRALKEADQQKRGLTQSLSSSQLTGNGSAGRTLSQFEILSFSFGECFSVAGL